MLPTKKTVKSTDFKDFLIMLYGDPKIGKSTACSRIENALFVPTEPGLKALEVYSEDLVTTWDQFIEICIDFSTKKHDFTTMVIDTFDNLYQLCADYICENYPKKVRHIGDIPFGKGSPEVRLEVKRVISKLADLPTGLVLVSHSVEQELETPTGTVLRTIPSFSTKVWGNKASKAYHAEFIGLSDIVLFATSEGDKRVIKSKPDKTKYEVGGRLNLFKDNMLLEDLFKGGK